MFTLSFKIPCCYFFISFVTIRCLNQCFYRKGFGCILVYVHVVYNTWAFESLAKDVEDRDPLLLITFVGMYHTHTHTHKHALTLTFSRGSSSRGRQRSVSPWCVCASPAACYCSSPVQRWCPPPPLQTQSDSASVSGILVGYLLLQSIAVFSDIILHHTFKQ